LKLFINNIEMTWPKFVIRPAQMATIGCHIPKVNIPFTHIIVDNSNKDVPKLVNNFDNEIPELE
jgi:hypothetical protein